MTCSPETWAALLRATLLLPLDDTLERRVGKPLGLGPISRRTELTEAQARVIIATLRGEEP